jgi:MYXO-CTERM domain-containing protein
VCTVRPDGEPECVLPSTLPENQPTKVALSGSGCSCTVGASGERGHAAAGLLVAIAFATALRRRRRGDRR